MESRTALQPHRRPQIPASSSSSSSRISSSQSYFDVYPERRANTPSHKLTSSSLKSLPNSEDEQGANRSATIHRRQYSPQRSPLVSCNRQESLREDAISSSTSNSWLTVSSGSADFTPSSSSSSLYSANLDSNTGDKGRRRKGNSIVVPMTATIPQRSIFSRSSSTLSSKGKAASQRLVPTNAGQAFGSSQDNDCAEMSRQNDRGTTPLRLKSQKSMPNVKARKYQPPETSGFSWLGSVGKKNAIRDGETNRSNDAAKILHAVHEIARPDESSDDSDSSLDSIGKEARSTLRVSMKAAKNATQPSKASHLTRSTDKTFVRRPVGQDTKVSGKGTRNGEHHLRYRSDIESRTPSPSTPNFTLSGTQERQIQRYIRSKRLNTMLTLTQAPYIGRVVSLADVGDRNGHPTFVFLGLGAVRYLAGLYDEMATVLGLRIICIDRWGQGKTDDIPADQRGVLEWSGVVTEVADRLGVRQFSILAHSAGAPYAMATTLMHSDRIAGPVHLLAPWVSPTIESGYKWLKYIPDGVIKTAQAADCRMQAWKLGVSRPLTGVSGPDSSDTRDSLSHVDEKGKLVPPSRTLSVENDTTPSSSTLPPLYRAFSRASLHSEKTNRPLLDDRRESSSADLASPSSKPSLSSNDRDRGQKIVMTASATAPYGLHRTLDASESPLLRKTLLQMDRYIDIASGAQSVELSDAKYAEEDVTQETKVINPTEIQAAPDLATALLRASHAENLTGGGSNDLLVILGRSSQKPWGFQYTDISHAVAVWYGDKDERISMTSILWMQRELDNCSVKIVKGATHDLMTNAAVVVEALESIATYRCK